MITFNIITDKVYFTSNFPKEVEKIKQILTFEVPNHEYNPAFKKGNWDGKQRYYNDFKQCFELNFLQFVISNLPKTLYHKITKSPSSKSFFSDEINKSYLLSHQYEAAKAFIANFTQTGIVKIPTRGGKTIFASEMIRLFLKQNSGNVLFIVDTIDLFNQARKEIGEYLKIQIGSINAETFDIQQVSVASIQTLIARLKNKKTRLMYLKYLREVKFLIVDEIHELSSDKRVSVINKINFQTILGLSATPFGNDEIKNMKIRKYAGDIVYEIQLQELVENKILAESKVFLINIDYMENKYVNLDYDEFNALRGRERYQYLNDQIIIGNNYRNNICTSLIEILRKMNLKVLVLVNRRQHGEKLASITGDIFVYGSHDSEFRNTSKEFFLKQKGGVIIASDIWKKGITLPEVDVLVNVGGGKDQNLLIQKKGRVLGVTKNKSRALIVDFVDNFDEYFNEHSLSRISVYEDSVGGDNISIFDSEDRVFYNDFRLSVKNWFGIT